MYTSSINDRYIDMLVDAMKAGDIIIYPTDTMYAIGCDALNNRAIERICRLKGMNPQRQRLSVVCSDISQASEYAMIDNRAFALMKPHLPGAFTFILPASPRLPKVFKGRREVGVRVPDNDIARELARRLGNPLLSTTVEVDAGDFDTVSAHAAAERYEHDVEYLIDGGDCTMAYSTVVDCTDSSAPEIIREGKGEIEL